MKRDIEIVTKYVNGWCLTYEELAKEYGITRERIRQILNKTLEPYQLVQIKKQNSQARQEIVADSKIGGPCKYCGNVKRKDRIYCNWECMKKDIQVSPEVRKEKMKGYTKKYFENNKDKIRAQSKKWREKPEVKAKLKIKQKERYLETKNNPEKLKLYKLNYKIYYYKKRIKNCYGDYIKVEKYTKILNNLIAEKR